MFHISIDGELISTSIIESRLDGVCVIPWDPPAIGVWNLTVEFNGKDQYSPTQLSFLVNISLGESRISLFHYSYIETPTGNQIQLEIEVTTSSGVPIPNASVTVNHNGTLVGGLTNSEGKTSIIVETGTLNGILNITLNFLGDELHASSIGGPYLIPTYVIGLPSLNMSQTLFPATIATGLISVSLVIIRKRRKNKQVPS